jgi:hypothetical protein
MKKILLSVAILMMATATPALADDNAKKAKALDHMITAMEMDKMMDNMYEMVVKSIHANMKRMDPHFNEAKASTYSQIFKEESKDYFTNAITKIKNIMAREYTLKEIEEINSFYDSPVGKKTISLQPKMMAEMAAYGQKEMPAIMQRTMTRIGAVNAK